MNRPLAVLGVAICSAVAALGQPSAKALRFEVASVKPSPETVSGGGWVRVGASGDAGRVSYTRVTLNNLLMTAYKVKRYQISGPDWMDRERYDVAAKLPEGSSKDQAPLMLQALLAERFQVALHREQKDLPACALAPAKGGFKLKPVENPSATMNLEAGSAGRRLQGTFSLSRLADLLTNFLGQPVSTRPVSRASSRSNWNGHPMSGNRGRAPSGSPTWLAARRGVSKASRRRPSAALRFLPRCNRAWVSGWSRVRRPWIFW